MDQNQNPYQNPYEPQNDQYGYQGGQQGYGMPQQTRQSYSFELPQQSPYGQYYGAQAKKKLNPLVIIIPAAVLIIVGLAIALIFVLGGSGSSGSNGGYVGGGNNVGNAGYGGNGGSNGGGSFVTDGGDNDNGDNDNSGEDEYGIEYDDRGNPIFTQQTLSNNSLMAYNSRNPFDISVSIYAAGDANKLAEIDTGDKKKIEQLIISDQFTAGGVEYDDSVEMIVGEPIKITYKQQELMQDYKIVISLSDSLLENTGYYPTVFSGIERYAVLYVDENDKMIVDSGDVLDSTDKSMTVSGHDGSAYIVLIDGDAMCYGLGIDPSLFETGDDNSGNGSGGQGQGVFTHSTYTSSGRFICEYIGIAADLGSEWTFATDSELADENGLMDMSDEALKKKLDSGYTVSDMSANKNSDVFLHLSYINNYCDSLDEYVDVFSKSWKETMEEYYDYVTVTKEYVKFAGMDVIRVTTLCEASNYYTYELDYYFDMPDGVIADLSFRSFDNDNLDDVTGLFYAI